MVFPSFQNDQELKQYIRQGYRIAALYARPDLTPRQGSPYINHTRDPSTNQNFGYISQKTANDIARKLGYTSAQLQSIPRGANMGLSCGNPHLITNFPPNATVLDLGCGGGFDSFLTAQQLSPSGRVIGIDMTLEMIEKANHNKTKFIRSTNRSNIEFHSGEFENLPLPNQSIDLIISNGAISLSPNQKQVWSELHRVLKPTGQVAIADIIQIQNLPPHTRHVAEDLVGSSAGSIPLPQYLNNIQSAHFHNTTLLKFPAYVNSLEELKSQQYAELQSLLPPDTHPVDVISTYHITATK